MGINNHCYVCHQETILFGQKILNTITNVSKTPLFTILEKLMGTTIFEASLQNTEEELEICYDCLQKFEEYDEAFVKFTKIESDLIEILQQSKDLNNEESNYYIKIEYLDETNYLDQTSIINEDPDILKLNNQR